MPIYNSNNERNKKITTETLFGLYLTIQKQKNIFEIDRDFSKSVLINKLFY